MLIYLHIAKDAHTTQPPRAVPSSLVRMNPVTPTTWYQAKNVRH
jgi:hypothetical protein